jgi:hypothetical protein
MLGVRVNISRYADASFPGWVECTLVDALGHEHVFVEKVPVVTKAHLDAASSYPQSGVIACVVLGSSESDDGRQFVRIDTQSPWGHRIHRREKSIRCFIGAIMRASSRRRVRFQLNSMTSIRLAARDAQRY